MAKINILNSKRLDITISRLSQQLIENHGDFKDSVIVGIQKSGVLLAERIKQRIKELADLDIPLGKLDITFHRDDFRRRDSPLAPNKTEIPFIIEGKNVILVDDVLYTGRSIRSAMDAMMAFGRPSKVEFLTLVDRKYSRHLPIEAKYVGKTVNSIQSQRVIVEWNEQGFAEDNIWLVNQ
ncbi:bifunctional pyr operon transcriptional regulator/uracil phosphoribosyltransferase PyrR [Limibacter armeniacum]|uniref:bifunctional pyr operon transcriptional regulator/uracil phosphoribosyltransferase PyrR n=1 Tax=Limibacter armeniacum TaxID=466084 RepID=UPI002FE6383B